MLMPMTLRNTAYSFLLDALYRMVIHGVGLLGHSKPSSNILYVL